jgi:hypothetical protein
MDNCRSRPSEEEHLSGNGADESFSQHIRLDSTTNARNRDDRTNPHYL